MKKILLALLLSISSLSLYAGGVTLMNAEDVKLGEGGLQIHAAPPQKNVAPAPISAQTQTTKPTINFNKVKFGMGAGLGINFAWYDEWYGYSTPAKILFTIQASKNFRIEPLFSFSLTHTTDSSDGDTTKRDNFNFLVGAGLFYTLPYKSALFIIGVRIAGGAGVYIRKDDSDDSWSLQPHMLIDPVIGGEYFLGEHFSIGGEITLGMNYYGDEKTSDDDDNYDDGDWYQFSINTSGTLYFRWYFF